MYVVRHDDTTAFYAWLRQDTFDQLQGQGGKATIRAVLDAVEYNNYQSSEAEEEIEWASEEGEVFAVGQRGVVTTRL